ncbi:MAG: diphthine--ammonia ligase [Flavisolibacter sp.]
MQNMMVHKSYFNWSGGKDSALALHYALQDKAYSIDRLLTNINGYHHRISMHGVREGLLDAQAEAIGLPLQKILLPEEPSMAEYETQMQQNIQGLKEEGFAYSFFGDIFLEDLRQYREFQLAGLGIQARFPLWKRNTTELILEFLDLGFKTIVVCTSAELLGKSFLGRMIDHDFLKDLPKGIDPCGENGEFHTFVYDGPIFKKPLSFSIGENIFREYKSPSPRDDRSFNQRSKKGSVKGFWFCDLVI